MHAPGRVKRREPPEDEIAEEVPQLPVPMDETAEEVPQLSERAGKRRLLLTPGCPGCTTTRRKTQAVHSSACLQRRKRDHEEAEEEMDAEELMEEPCKLRRSARLAAKRGRDPSQERCLEEEEEEARGADAEREVDELRPFVQEGPPWCDEYTNKILPEKEVEEAMAAERENLKKFQAFEEVS